jgi:hypothetical protein
MAHIPKPVAVSGSGDADRDDRPTPLDDRR